MMMPIESILRDTIEQTFIAATAKMSIVTDAEGNVDIEWPDIQTLVQHVLARVNIAELEAVVGENSGWSVDDLMTLLTRSERGLFEAAMEDPANTALFVKVQAARIQKIRILPGDGNFVEMMGLLVGNGIITPEKAQIIGNVLAGTA